MFCRNCGNQLGSDDSFCPSCGAVVENIENESTPPVVEEVVAETQPTGFCGNCGAPLYNPEATLCDECAVPNSNQKPGSKGKKIVIGVVAALVVCLAVFFTAPYMGNAFAKLFKSPEDYLAHVVGKQTDKLVDNAAGVYSVYKKMFTSKLGGKNEVSLTLGEDFADTLSDLTGEDIDDYIGWLESVAWTMDSSCNDGNMKASMDLKLNNKDIADVEMYYDFDGDAYIAIPSLNPDYIRMDMSEAYGGQNPYEVMASVFSSLPDEKLLQKMIGKYMDKAISAIDDVEESSVKISAEGVTQKVTCLEFDISEETALDMAEAVLLAAQEDKDFEKLVTPLLENEDLDLDADFSDVLDAIDDALESIDDSRDYASSDAVCTVSLYVNAKGEIVGTMIDASDSADFVIEAYTARKGSKFGTVIELDADGASVSLNGTGKETFGKYSGELELRAMGTSVVTIEFSGVNSDKWADGIFNGEATITPGSVTKLLGYYADSDLVDFISDCSIVIKSKTTSMETLSYTLTIKSNDSELATLNVANKPSSAAKIKLPENYVDSDDYDDMEDWADNISVDKLIENLEKAGAPNDIIDAIEDNMP